MTITLSRLFAREHLVGDLGRSEMGRKGPRQCRSQTVELRSWPCWPDPVNCVIVGLGSVGILIPCSVLVPILWGNRETSNIWSLRTQPALSFDEGDFLSTTISPTRCSTSKPQAISSLPGSSDYTKLPRMCNMHYAYISFKPPTLTQVDAERLAAMSL